MTADTTASALDGPIDGGRHIRYWLRCFRTLLPHHYTSNDSIRLTLGFFIISALDILSPSSDKPLATPEERQQLQDWVLNLQHPYGGFCGSPHHALPREFTHGWDPNAKVNVARDPSSPNIAATGFALLCLGVLADDDGSSAFAGVNRARTLNWLKKLQRDDGSFGDVLTDDGNVSGGRDMRHCYFATIIRWALGAGQSDADKSLDIDVDALVQHIRRAQTFDGGMAESSTHESHSGYAFCAVAALAMLDLANTDPSAAPDHYIRAGIPSIPSLVHFLVNRQFAYLEAPEGDEQTGDEPESANHTLPDLSSLSISDTDHFTGFNGRPNKLPDTCYTWWVSGALSLLGEHDVVDRVCARRFILQKTQHRIGGFGKHPGSPPDIYHGYMGLAALGTIAGEEGEAGLKKFDPRLCISADTAAKLVKAKEGLLADEEGEDLEEWIASFLKPDGHGAKVPSEL
ncbi:terpenoid cyclases/Protein prenyltransferase [Xylariaceae sp. FL1272]|nr:terpenoid cyclases/Protein prenyltransferase [Xylariaceae sp. FL1272]